MLTTLKNMKLRIKLMIAFGVFAAFFVSTATVIFTMRLSDASTEHQKTLLRNFAELTSKNISAGLDFGDKASVTGSLESIKSVMDYAVVLDVNGEVVSSFSKNAKNETSMLERVRTNITAWRDAKRKIWLFDAPGLDAILVPVNNSVGNEIGVLSMGLSTESAEVELRGNILFSAILMVTSVGLGLLAAYGLSKLLVRPINTILAMLRDIAEGEGDLTKRMTIDAKDEIGELASTFNVFVEKLQDLIGKVADASAQIGRSVESISSSTNSVATGADQQSNQATLVAVAAEEMSATIVQTSSNTADAVRLSQQAQSATERGKLVVEDTVSGLQNISQVVSESAQTLLELGKTVAQIGTVVEVINDIADQINLLSLNASIEAATAGDYGKGFAVVANEVKNLAEDTTRSTTEISLMIEKIQQAMSNAIRAMERGTGEVEKGRELGNKTADAFDEILKANNHVKEMITNISVSAQQQSHSAEEISKNIENIANITRNTAHGVRQIDNTTETLVQHTSQLKTLVGRFKLQNERNYN